MTLQASDLLSCNVQATAQAIEQPVVKRAMVIHLRTGRGESGREPVERCSRRLQAIAIELLLAMAGELLAVTGLTATMASQ